MSSSLTLRRSVLFVPASNTRALEKSRTLNCDAVIIDLEDAVAPAAKSAARAAAVGALSASRSGHQERVLRINPAGTPWHADDLRAAAGSGADAVLLPKVDDPAAIQAASAALASAGAPDSLALWAMAETPQGILNSGAIASASDLLRVIVMGTSDLSKAMRLPPDPGRTGLQAALAHSVLAARAHGLDILDGVFGDLTDDAGFRASCQQGKKLGFDGKTLIHPGQIATANEVFGIPPAEIERARQIVAAWESAAASGKGIAVSDGQMIEQLHADEARRLLALGELIVRRS